MKNYANNPTAPAAPTCKCGGPAPVNLNLGRDAWFGGLELVREWHDGALYANDEDHARDGFAHVLFFADRIPANSGFFAVAQVISDDINDLPVHALCYVSATIGDDGAPYFEYFVTHDDGDYTNNLIPAGHHPKTVIEALEYGLC